MQFLHKIKIRTKLVMLLCIMVFATIIVGAIAFLNENQTGKALTSIYSQNLTSIELLSDARTQSRANFANILNLMVTRDKSGQDKIIEDINKRNENIKTDFAGYEKTKLNSSETEQYELIKKSMTEWNAIAEELISQVTSGGTEDAIEQFKNGGEEKFEALQTSIRGLVDYNKQDADSTYAKMDKDKKAAAVLLIVVILAAIAVSNTLGILIVTAVSKPIAKVVNLIKKTSDLDLAYDHSYDALLHYDDEIGTIAKAVEDLRTALRSMAGNVTAIADSLAANSEELAASTDENTKTVNQIVNAINEIAEGNSIQANTIEKTSERISEIVKSIDDVNHSESESSVCAEKSLEIIADGQNAINITISRMEDSSRMSVMVGNSISELSKEMEKVSYITGVIDSIATQTNLLALNAAIEAARAGEVGKGFSVVAEEIRKLADSSAAAVKEITDIIDKAVDSNAQAAKNMEKAKIIVDEQEKAVMITKGAFDNIQATMEDIAARTINTAKAISVIDAASREIAGKTEEMSAVAQQGAASSQEISASNEEQLAAIEMVAGAAGELSAMAVRLQEETGRFRL